MNRKIRILFIFLLLLDIAFFIMILPSSVEKIFIRSKSQINSIDKDLITDGYFEFSNVDNRSGFVVIHPKSLTTGRFVEKQVKVPKGNFFINIGLSDIAGKLPGDLYGYSLCADVGFKILINDSNNLIVLKEIIINSEDGWVDLDFNISNYSNKIIVVRVESYAGGPCGLWNGEWAAVSHINVSRND